MILRFSSTIAAKQRSELKSAIAYAAHSTGVDHVGLLVNVRNGRGGGMAYNFVWRKDRSQAGQCRMIGLRVPSPDTVPVIRKINGIVIEAATVYEWMVFIAGHEFGHILDYQKRRPPTEQRATWYGWNALREYKAVSFKPTVLPADSTPTPSPSEIADNADRQAESDYSHSDGAHSPDD